MLTIKTYPIQTGVDCQLVRMPMGARLLGMSRRHRGGPAICAMANKLAVKKADRFLRTLRADDRPSSADEIGTAPLVGAYRAEGGIYYVFDMGEREIAPDPWSMLDRPRRTDEAEATKAPTTSPRLAPYVVDLTRENMTPVGIYVGAYFVDSWGSWDIACLDRPSLLRWLRHGESQFLDIDRPALSVAERTVLMMLGHPLDTTERGAD